MLDAARSEELAEGADPTILSKLDHMSIQACVNVVQAGRGENSFRVSGLVQISTGSVLTKENAGNPWRIAWNLTLAGQFGV